MTRILAVDPSSTEVGLYDGRSLCFTIKLKGDRPARLGELFKELDYHAIGYDFVVYEEQFVRGGAATKALYAAVGIIEAAATIHGQGVMSVPQSTLRKWAESKVGKAPDTKTLMRWVAAERLTADTPLPRTEHEWDAAALWFYIQEKGIING